MKKIDAVRMVREIRDKQHAETAGKTPEQVREYYRQKSLWVLENQPQKPATTKNR